MILEQENHILLSGAGYKVHALKSGRAFVNTKSWFDCDRGGEKGENNNNFKKM